MTFDQIALNEALNAGFSTSEALEYVGISDLFIVQGVGDMDGYGFDLYWEDRESYILLEDAIAEARALNGRVLDLERTVFFVSPNAPKGIKGE